MSTTAERTHAQASTEPSLWPQPGSLHTGKQSCARAARECRAVPLVGLDHNLTAQRHSQGENRVIRGKEHGKGDQERACILRWKPSSSLPC